SVPAGRRPVLVPAPRGAPRPHAPAACSGGSSRSASSLPALPRVGSRCPLPPMAHYGVTLVLISRWGRGRTAALRREPGHAPHARGHPPSAALRVGRCGRFKGDPLLAACLRFSVPLCAIVACLPAGSSTRPLGLGRTGRKLRARLWKRRLTLFGLLLLTLGVIGMQPGWVARGGWIARVLQAVVGLEVVLMGGWLVHMDLVELAQRVARRQAVARQNIQDRHAEAAAPEGPPKPGRS